MKNKVDTDVNSIQVSSWLFLLFFFCCYFPFLMDLTWWWNYFLLFMPERMFISHGVRIFILFVIFLKIFLLYIISMILLFASICKLRKMIPYILYEGIFSQIFLYFLNMTSFVKGLIWFTLFFPTHNNIKSILSSNIHHTFVTRGKWKQESNRCRCDEVHLRMQQLFHSIINPQLFRIFERR